MGQVLTEINLIYNQVADHYARKIVQIFNSEETLAEFFSSQMGPGLPLDRTNHWNILLRGLLEDSWIATGPEVKTSITGYDILAILQNMKGYLDYNLYTQVYANLTAHKGYSYDAGAAHQNLQELEAKYKDKKISPFEAKAKMNKLAQTEEEKEYNKDLSAIKALRILEKCGMTRSFRVSPMGSTPAFADSDNIGMIGSGGDAFLRVSPGYQVFYILWSRSPRMVNVDLRTGGLSAAGIGYPFFSKSGGDVLNDVLFSRYVAYEAIKQFDLMKIYVDVLPRMSSVMILAPVGSEIPKKIYDHLLPMCNGLTFYENSRPTS